jgi:hypothetical protein
MQLFEVEGSAELGVSELVTNALLHARTAFSVIVQVVASGRVRIAVSDSSDLPVQSRHPGVGATTGRGLALVAAVSFDRGTDPRAAGEVGKTVWFEPRPSTGEDGEVQQFSTEDWVQELHRSS